MDPRAYAIHKRLMEKTGQPFKPPSTRSQECPRRIPFPIIRPPENCENRKPHAFAYDPLPTATSIRLVELHPEKFESVFDIYAPLRCSLVVRDLDDAPIYDALSYSWGSPVAVYSSAGEVSSDAAWAAPAFDIICNGMPLSVTTNLYTALLSLRLRASEAFRAYCDLMAWDADMSLAPSLHIWIDQICINQTDLKERSAQIMLMRRIYKQA